jgi:hypothetical protein
MYFLRRLYDTINDGEVPANQKIFIGMASICDFFLNGLISSAMLTLMLRQSYYKNFPVD